MTKKQEKIYNWLLKNPGYIKKGVGFVESILPFTDNSSTNEARTRNVKIALREARKNVKKSTTLKKVNSPKNDPSNVLIIGDTHFPFEKSGYLDFCLDLQRKYKCGTVVHIGDEIDNCAVSQYIKDPDGFSAGSEMQLALDTIKVWYKAFPDVKVCIGNHTARPFRLAHDAGLSKKFLKTYEQMWEAPKGWIWRESWDLFNVHYTHGTGTHGPNAALKRAIQLRKSVAMGHVHTEATIQYNVSSVDAIFGMIVGAGIDDKQYAFHYAKDSVKKSIISAGTILENGRIPIIELMKL